MNKLISVIIPIYNVEPYLRRCLNSVLNQTYSNLEIILVDDGSPDNCPSICDEYANNDTRIVVIHKKNGGLSDARNAGLDICKGDYITFVDSDDWITPHYVETLLDSAIRTSSDISIGEIKKTYEASCVLNNQKTTTRILNSREAVERLFSKTEASFVAACGKLFKRNIIIHIRFPKNKIHEDEYLNYQWLYNAKKIVYIDQVLYFYFQRPNSIMGEDLEYADEEIYVQQKNFFLERNEKKILKALDIRRTWTLLLFYWKAYTQSNSINVSKRKKQLQNANIPLIYSFRHIMIFPFLKLWKKYPTLYVFFKHLKKH